MNHNKKKLQKKKEKTKNFGMGEMIHCFSDEGRTPSIIKELYILQITGASSQANSFNILFGNMSGPGDLLSLIRPQIVEAVVYRNQKFVWNFDGIL